MGIGTEVAVVNSQVVPISQVVLKTGFTVFGTLIPSKGTKLGDTVLLNTGKEVTYGGGF